jgi:hypothetical protein
VALFELVLTAQSVGQVYCDGGVLFTLRRGMDSSLCRGTTVTISISQRKATSDGTRPGGRGNAMLFRSRLFGDLLELGELQSHLSKDAIEDWETRLDA